MRGAALSSQGRQQEAQRVDTLAADRARLLEYDSGVPRPAR